MLASVTSRAELPSWRVTSVAPPSRGVSESSVPDSTSTGSLAGTRGGRRVIGRWLRRGDGQRRQPLYASVYWSSAVHWARLNGAKVLAGSRRSAARYCARRTVNGADRLNSSTQA